MDFLNSSFRIGSIAGINVRVHILFVIFVGFRLISAGEHWERTLAFLTLLFGIVLCHEFGHCFGARAVGGDARDILLWPLGGLAMVQHPKTPWAQFVTVAAGPLVNVVFCIASLLVLWSVRAVGGLDFGFMGGVALAHGAPIWAWYLAIFYDVNYFLLIFNLLPVYPMDGGRLLETFLWLFVGLHRAIHIACTVGLMGAVGLGLWGLSSGGGGMLTFIAIFGGFACWQQLQMLKYGHVVDERIRRYDPPRRSAAKGSWWSRLLGRRPTVGPTENPNPGGWQAKVEREREGTAEVDRILQKVHEKGIGALSYIERQTLERATRERRGDERVDADQRR